ncbi:SPOR domain-containing protein [Pseudomonas sp. Marseille-QA0892]
MQRGLKQRIIGALVLLALAIIFLPMLFTRQNELRHTVVEAPPAPTAPAMPEISMDQTTTPQPQPIDNSANAPGIAANEGNATTPQDVPEEAEPVIIPEDTAVASVSPSKPAEPPKPPQQPIQPITEAKPAPAPAPPPESRLDANSLPVSWSVQLASLSNRASAENLQNTLRKDGYNAYIRTAGGMNRVFVGPVIERSEADKLRAQLSRQQKLDGFVVRFQPEEG